MQTNAFTHVFPCWPSKKSPPKHAGPLSLLLLLLLLLRAFRLLIAQTRLVTFEGFDDVVLLAVEVQHGTDVLHVRRGDGCGPEKGIRVGDWTGGDASYDYAVLKKYTVQWNRIKTTTMMTMMMAVVVMKMMMMTTTTTMIMTMMAMIMMLMSTMMMTTTMTMVMVMVMTTIMMMMLGMVMMMSLLCKSGIRSMRVVSPGFPSHFFRIKAFLLLSPIAFSLQSMTRTLDRSRFRDKRSCRKTKNHHNLHYREWALKNATVCEMACRASGRKNEWTGERMKKEGKKCVTDIFGSEGEIQAPSIRIRTFSKTGIFFSPNTATVHTQPVFLVFAFTCGRSNTIRKRYVCTQIFFKCEEKNLCCRKYPGTCEQLRTLGEEYVGEG